MSIRDQIVEEVLNRGDRQEMAQLIRELHHSLKFAEDELACEIVTSGTDVICADVPREMRLD